MVYGPSSMVSVIPYHHHVHKKFLSYASGDPVNYIMQKDYGKKGSI